MNCKTFIVIPVLFAFQYAKSQCPPPTGLSAYQLTDHCGFHFEWTGDAPFYKIKVYANDQQIFSSKGYFATTSYEIFKAPLEEGIDISWKVRSGCSWGNGSDWVEGPEFESFNCDHSSIRILSGEGNDGSIFPNPSSGDLTIDFHLDTKASTATIAIRNMAGRIVYSSEAPLDQGRLYSNIHFK